jgi:predicted peptidase
MLFVLAIGVVLALTWPAGARQDGEVFQGRSLTIEGKTFQYRVFVPKGWSGKKKWPVILFLHGAGERGDDNLEQTRVGIGPAILRQQDSLKSIVVMPQCPRNRWWSEPDMQAMALKSLDQTAKEFNGDAARTYLTGLSMGGYGSWTLAATNPKKFAAIVVVCGGVRPPPRLNLPQAMTGFAAEADPYGAVAARVGKTPVWAFHGDADLAVPVTESRNMVEALKAARGDVRYNEYPGVGHNSWDKAYAEPELFPWLMSQHKK